MSPTLYGQFGIPLGCWSEPITTQVPSDLVTTFARSVTSLLIRSFIGKPNIAWTPKKPPIITIATNAAIFLPGMFENIPELESVSGSLNLIIY